MLETLQKAASRSSRKKQDRFKISPTSTSMVTESGDASEKDAQACWTLMSRSEKVLLVLLVITVIILIAAFIVIAYLFITGQNVCESPSCVKASAQLLETAVFSTDPCDDFYQFICGNYIRIREDCEDEARLKKEAVVSALLEKDSSESLTVAKQFYQACIDVNEENSNGTVLLSLISQIGGWPLLMGARWQENGFHWLNFMVDLRSKGFKYDWFISLDYYENADGENLLLIGPPDLEPVISTNHFHMVAVSEALGSSSAVAWDEMKKVHELENKLANISHIAQNILEENDNKNYVTKTVKELNRDWPTIRMTDILNNLAGGYAHFDNDTTVVTTGNHYLLQLNLLLRMTPQRTQANYLIWKIIESFLPFSSEQLRVKYSNLPNRKDHCLSETTRRFYSGLQLYIGTNKKNAEIEESITLMTDLVKKGIIGDGVKSTKVDIIGIETPSISESLSIMKMINEVNKWSDNAFYNCLHKKSTICSKESYHSDPKHLEINFDIKKNSIDVPFVLLHSDWYRWNQPNYINYARLGRTLADVFIEAMHQKNQTMNGHEISGVDLAYASYQEWTRREGKEQSLPAIEYSTNQLFWIHSSSMYCSSTNDSLKFDEVTDSKYFGKDFNCKI